jgi:HK97 family phage portal protein
MKITDAIARMWNGSTAITKAAPLPLPRPGETGLFAFRFPDPEIDLHPIKTTEQELSAFAGWVYAATTTISTDVGATPWHLIRGTEDNPERVPFKDIPPLFLRPNDIMTFRDVIELTTLHLDLTGEAFWNLITAGPESDEVIGWQVIYPQWVDEPVVQNGRLTGWRVSVPNAAGASHVTIPTRDMVFFRYPHPAEPLAGASPVEAFALSHDLDMQARGYGAGLLKNNAIPPLVITSEQTLTPRDSNLIGERWKDRHLRRPGEPAVMGKGATVQLLGLTLEQIGLESIDKMTRQQVFGSYGVPESKKGLVEDVNRANAESNERTYQRNVIWPRLERIDTCINTFVIPRVSGLENTLFKHENPIQEDKDFILEKTEKMIARGMITINQGLRMLGEEEQADGNVFLIPTNVERIPAGQLETPAESRETIRIRGEVEDRGSHLFENPMYELGELRFLSKQDPLERRLLSEFRRLFSKQQKEVVAAYLKNAERLQGRKYFKDWTKIIIEAEEGDLLSDHLREKQTPEGPILVKRELAIPTVTKDELDDAVDGTSDEWIAAAFLGYTVGHQAGWSLAADTLDIAIDFDLIRARAAERAQRQAAQQMTAVLDTTKARVQRIVALGIENGSSPQIIAGQIRAEFDRMKGSRALMIARTESAAPINWAFNETMIETQRRTNTPLEKFWITILDGLEREDHNRAHRQRREVDKPFSVGGRSMMHPLDPAGGPAQVINCRCTMTVKKAPKKRRRFR